MGKKIIVIVLLVSFLAGCATTDREKTVGQGALGGAAIGAALGAIVGAVAGGKEGAAIGAAVGGAVGGAAGAAYGAHVANKKQQFKTSEEYLDACIVSAQQANDDARQCNQKLAGEIEQVQKETDKLVAAYKHKRTKKVALVNHRERIKAMVAESESKLKTAQQELDIQQKVLVTEKAEKDVSNDRISKLQSVRDQLSDEFTTLVGYNGQLMKMDTQLADTLASRREG